MGQWILSQKQEFRSVETNWMWKGKARRPSLPQPRCSAQLSALRIVVLGCWAYYLLLPPTTSYSTSYNTLPPSPATILSPSLAASAPSELCLDPAPLNLKALCYMISLNLNQVMTLAYDSLLIATAPFQSTAILRIMTLVLQMIHAMGPSLSWFCTAFRETFARI